MRLWRAEAGKASADLKSLSDSGSSCELGGETVDGGRSLTGCVRVFGPEGNGLSWHVRTQPIPLRAGVVVGNSMPELERGGVGSSLPRGTRGGRGGGHARVCALAARRTGLVLVAREGVR